MDDITSRQLKVRENTIRRVAGRRGLELHKSRRRDPLAPDYGLWTIRAGDQILASAYNLDSIERELDRIAQERVAQLHGRESA